jgi:hypothetical protein
MGSGRRIAMENNAYGHMAEPYRPEMSGWHRPADEQQKPAVNLTCAAGASGESGFDTGVA